MKKHIILFLLIFVFFKYGLNAQISTGCIPHSRHKLNLTQNIPTIALPEIDVEDVLNQIKGKNDSSRCMGKLRDVNIDLVKDGQKTMLDNEKLMFRLKIVSKNAKSIRLLFDKFYLTENSAFFVYNPDYSDIAGAFTEQNNKEDEKFAVHSIIGDELVLELVVPKDDLGKVKVQINYVSHIFVDLRETFLKSTSAYTDCFFDVHCDNFIQNQIRSVMRWVYENTEDGLSYYCSCSLLNQDVNPNDLKYYVLTADHCGGDADLSNATFYFNDQERDCNIGYGTSVFTTTGATQLAKSSTCDMFLMELIESPPEDYNIHFAGWDRSEYFYLWSWVVGIHHPHGWVKKTSRGDLLVNTNLYNWRVEWDEYPIAGGSSGSPLFEDFYGRVIGQLSDAFWDDDCSHPSQTYYYGKLRKEWTGTSSSNRLKDWLDPDNNDKTGIDGRDPCYTDVEISGPYKNLRSAQADYQPENNVIIQAGDELSTSNTVTILSGADYTFRAGNRIRLNPGFRVELGASLRMELEPCEQYKYGPIGTKSVALNPGLNIDDLRKEEAETVEPETPVVQLYPNPFTSHIEIGFVLPQQEKITIRLVNSMGETVKILADKLYGEGESSELYNLSGLPCGVYLVLINSDNIKQNIKIIKR